MGEQVQRGVSIRLYLEEGVADGVVTARIPGWAAIVVHGPRSKWRELVNHSAAKRTGVYFLVGESEEGGNRAAYIGEGNVADRLADHHRKDKWDWEEVCFVTGDKHYLGKDISKYVESRLQDIVEKAGRVEMRRGQVSSKPDLPKQDEDVAEGCVDNIKLIPNGRNGPEAWKHVKTGQAFGDWDKDQASKGGAIS